MAPHPPEECDAVTRWLVVGNRAVLYGVWACMACTTPQAAGAQPVPAHHVLHRANVGGWAISVTAPTTGTGLRDAVLTASRGARVVRVPLDTTPTGRRAAAIDRVALHEPSGRLLVLTDTTRDASGALVIDLQGETLAASLTGRHLTVSPDARFIAFEEYYGRLDTPWPWNETVYAVLDVAAAPAAMRRDCPFSDDRCVGTLLYLPSRQALCADRLARTGELSCLEPGRDPQHERRSPFIWLDATTLAFVSVDRLRESASAVLAVFGDAGAPPQVQVHPCDPVNPDPGSRCPPVRTAWSVDRIRPDDDGRRVWVHFRDRIPEVPGGWLPLARYP